MRVIHWCLTFADADGKEHLLESYVMPDKFGIVVPLDVPAGMTLKSIKTNTYDAKVEAA